MNQKSIILFDGVCNLCNSSIDFILKRDKSNRFLVGALQEEPGKAILARYQAKPDYLDSLVVVENEKIFFRSTAALKIAKNLSGLWPLFYGFIFIPAFLRDPVYDWIGKNRYRWFGKKNTCRIPTPEEKAKFLTLDKIQL
ncbi:thiol-disulfide oxidoreductase DCC family protein [Algoriphagus mannitolivorans]|uniref:thiol-disulfide oxidoreductase DCC family protein n=1 Tax=Algoriphagus mannitolivorans TaxID=226504 RepID=UPI00041DF0B8|nr:DCC1-like thiol-disulfide oxidoreductase family protein [Algoriphagus mannitolivorans]